MNRSLPSKLANFSLSPSHKWGKRRRVIPYSLEGAIQVATFRLFSSRYSGLWSFLLLDPSNKRRENFATVKYSSPQNLITLALVVVSSGIEGQGILLSPAVLKTHSPLISLQSSVFLSPLFNYLSYLFPI